MIKFNDLIVTQLSVRNIGQIPGMAKFVQDGGVFTKESLKQYAEQHGEHASPLVQINRFEDGGLYILDGHHRGVGILAGGRDRFLPEEYRLLTHTYQDLLDIVFLRPDGSWLGWITPFDPRTHVRLPDVKLFKDQVSEIYQHYGAEKAIEFIRANPDLYSISRTSCSIRRQKLDALLANWTMAVSD